MRRSVAAALACGLAGAAALAVAPSLAQAPKHDGHHRHQQPPASPYAGQEQRAIKSLSAEDIAALRRGAGWGPAKAAELNGLPGPAHLLELKDRIPLTAAQVARITALHADMQRRAVAAGARLIALEKTLNEGFAAGTMTEARLRELLGRIGAARAALRFVHLSAHLETPAILSAGQIARYNALRGYAR